MREIVGFDDIVGMAGGAEYGPSEVGNAAQAAQFSTPPGQTALLARNLPKSVVGIPLRDPIAPGITDEFTIDVQREFRPDRLMLVDYDGAANAAETDLYRLKTFRIGDTNLNASPNPVPIACFNPVAVGTSIRAPRTTDPSLGIDIALENAVTPGEGAPEWLVAGAVYGPSARPGRGGNNSVAGIVGAADDAASDPSQQTNNDAKDLPQSFVGIPYTDAPTTARQVVTINCQIYRDVRPDRLCLGAATANGQQWFVRDMRVGTTSLNASTHPIPGQCFNNLAFGNRLRATVTATPSVGITLDVFSLATGINTQGAFCGAFFGPSRFPST